MRGDPLQPQTPLCDCRGGQECTDLHTEATCPGNSVQQTGLSLNLEPPGRAYHATAHTHEHRCPSMPLAFPLAIKNTTDERLALPGVVDLYLLQRSCKSPPLSEPPTPSGPLRHPPPIQFIGVGAVCAPQATSR